MVLLVLTLAALVYGPATGQLMIVDENQHPIAAATVVFIDALEARDTQHADPKGRVSVRPGFRAVRALVSARGFTTSDVILTAQTATVELKRSLSIIGSVRVATDSLRSIHALPFAASVLDSAAIAHSEAITSDELLRQLPGFDRGRSNSAFTNYGQLRVSFSGAGNDRGVVLVDGVPAQDGFGGQVDWAAYPPENIERAELLRGAGSALYGAGAVGGVLDLQTFGPNADASKLPQGTVSFVAGTHDYSQQYANVRAPLSTKLTASLASEQRFLEYFDFPPSFRSSVDNVALSQSTMLAARFRYTASPSTILEAGVRSAWDYQQEGRQNYEFSRRLTQVDARFLHRGASALTTAAFFVRNARVLNVADRYPENPGSLRYTQNVPTFESGGALSWIVQQRHGTFELRGDGRLVSGESDQYDSSKLFQSLGSGSQRFGGIAAQKTLTGKRLELIAGVRADTVSFSNSRLATAGKSRVTVTNPLARTDQALSARAAFRYDVTPQLSVRISSGSGFRAPFLNELVRGYFIGNVAYQPNPALAPERSRTIAVGSDWTNGRVHTSLDAIETVVSNAIAFRTIDRTHQLRDNIVRTQTNGATLTFAKNLGPCSRLALWVTSQHARITAGDPAIIGKHLQYVPQSSANIGYEASAGRLSLAVHASYMGQTYADDLNRQPLGAAIVVGAHVRAPIGNGASMTVSVDNLTGARYLSSIDRYGQPMIATLSFALPVGPLRDRELDPCTDKA